MNQVTSNGATNTLSNNFANEQWHYANESQKDNVISVMQNQFAVAVSNVCINDTTVNAVGDASITALIANSPIDIFISTNRFGLIQEHGAAAKLNDDLYIGWNYQ